MIKKLKFIGLCLILFCSTFGIPIVSWIIVLIIPFFLKALGYLQFSRHLLKNRYCFPTSLLLVLFVLSNYSTIYFYNIYGDRTLINSLFQTLMIPIFFFTGVFLNYRKVPFYPYNVVIVNLFLFSGGIIWSFLSLGKYLSWRFSLADLILSSSVSSDIYNNEARHILSFWSDSFVGAIQVDIFTGFGVSLLGAILLEVIELVYSKSSSLKNKGRNIILVFLEIIIFSISFPIMVVLGSRTPFMTMIISFFCCIAYALARLTSILFYNKKTTTVLFGIISVTSLLIFLLILASFDRMNLINTISNNSHIGVRSFEKGLDTERYILWLSAIDQMFDHPWGGKEMVGLIQQIDYVHNIWLDQLYLSGIIPMMLLLAFHILQIPIILDFFSLRPPLSLALFYICVLVSLSVNFIFQPVIQLNYFYFGASCFLFGSTMRLTIDSRVTSH